VATTLHSHEENESVRLWVPDRICSGSGGGSGSSSGTHSGGGTHTKGGGAADGEDDHASAIGTLDDGSGMDTDTVGGRCITVQVRCRQVGLSPGVSKSSLFHCPVDALPNHVQREANDAAASAGPVSVLHVRARVAVAKRGEVGHQTTVQKLKQQLHRDLYPALALAPPETAPAVAAPVATAPAPAEQAQPRAVSVTAESFRMRLLFLGKELVEDAGMLCGQLGQQIIIII
jgi:hypothetical protein